LNHLNLGYVKGKLQNGLEYILYQDNSLPLVSVNIWYKVGSAYEKKGKTGLAHLFEHMMFQGSENVPKEMHFKYIQEAGGTLNGSTSTDRTNYYEKLPSNNLEVALWLESDRMGYFLPALTQEKLDNQKDVVRNERLERYDNQPYGLAWEILNKNVYPEDHPYSWITIGHLKDIESYTLYDVKHFFQTYYSPNNASIVVAGDINKEKTIDLINKYFGEINSFKVDSHPQRHSVKLKNNVYVEHVDDVQLERLYLSWPSDFIFGKDDASLEICSDILSGSKNSRLHKKLVFDLQIAQDVTSFQYSGKFGGQFIIISTIKPGQDTNKIKQLILDEINEIATNGVTEKELEKSRNGIKSQFVYSMQNLDTVADHLNYYNYHLGEPNSFEFDLNRYNSVTNDSIKNALQKYLFNPYVELRIKPRDN
jgi:zinc protease